jgi:hypothetical protein
MDINNNSVPISFLLRANFTSLFNLAVICFFILELGFKRVHTLVEIRVIKIGKIAQDIEKMAVLGSKIENRFVII